MTILFKKEYSGESISDSPEDIMNAVFDSSIPQDEYGYHQGTFTIIIEWSKEE